MLGSGPLVHGVTLRSPLLHTCGHTGRQPHSRGGAGSPGQWPGSQPWTPAVGTTLAQRGTTGREKGRSGAPLTSQHPTPTPWPHPPHLVPSPTLGLHLIQELHLEDNTGVHAWGIREASNHHTTAVCVREIQPLAGLEHKARKLPGARGTFSKVSVGRTLPTTPPAPRTTAACTQSEHRWSRACSPCPLPR